MLVIIVTFVLNILIIMKLIEFTDHFSNEESCEQYLTLIPQHFDLTLFISS